LFCVDQANFWEIYQRTVDNCIVFIHSNKEDMFIFEQQPETSKIFFLGVFKGQMGATISPEVRDYFVPEIKKIEQNVSVNPENSGYSFRI
jgi:hypothetical protein